MDDKKQFPSTLEEALTMLYLEKTITSEITPEELVKKYDDTFELIKAEQKKLKDSKPQKTQRVFY